MNAPTIHAALGLYDLADLVAGVLSESADCRVLVEELRDARVALEFAAECGTKNDIVAAEIAVDRCRAALVAESAVLRGAAGLGVAR